MPKQLRDENSNEDGPSDGQKPLKKARYVWEVKGKHHLKDAYKNTTANNNNNNNVDFSLEVENNKLTDSHPEVLENNNLEDKNIKSDETIGDKDAPPHSKCCNSCCIQKLLEEADEIMSAELDEISNEIPLTLVTPNPKNEDYYLRKWQARQIARGFVDNTINSVLDTWSSRPLDAADMVDNYANDGQVEDDAILMAIQSHGLQSNSRLDQPSSSITENERTLQRNSEIEEFTNDNLENFENERKEQESGSSLLENSESTTDGGPQDLGIDDTMDFLSAAVSVAIQKKGLSYSY